MSASDPKNDLLEKITESKTLSVRDRMDFIDTVLVQIHDNPTENNKVLDDLRIHFLVALEDVLTMNAGVEEIILEVTGKRKWGLPTTDVLPTIIQLNQKLCENPEDITEVAAYLLHSKYLAGGELTVFSLTQRVYEMANYRGRIRLGVGR